MTSQQVPAESQAQKIRGFKIGYWLKRLWSDAFIILILSYSISGCGIFSASRGPDHKQPGQWCEKRALPVIGALRAQGSLRWFAVHRARVGYADNSLMGIEANARLGAPLLEVDVRVAPDGTLFLFHDALIRPDNSIAPENFRFKRIARLESSELGKIYPSPSSDRPIPLLREGLEIIKRYNSALQLDLKGESVAVADAVIKEVVKEDAVQHVVIQCHDLETALHIRKSAPNLAIDIRVRDESALQAALGLKPEIVELEGWSTPEAISRVHAATSKVLVNSTDGASDYPSHWEGLYRDGVDIILTNKGTRMAKYFPECNFPPVGES